MKRIIIVSFLLMVIIGNAANAIDMTHKTGFGLFGPYGVCPHYWINDNFSFGLGIQIADSGLTLPVSGNYVLKKFNDGKLRLSLCGGYNIEFEEGYCGTKSWYGLGAEYIFGKLSLKGFYGSINTEEEIYYYSYTYNGNYSFIKEESEYVPKLEIIYYF